MKKVKIKALENSKTKMTPGKVYEVSEESSEFLVKHKRAIKAKDSEKVGKVYDYPKSKKEE